MARGGNRLVKVLVSLSDAELLILEDFMVSRGLRQRAVALRYAMLEQAGERERAQHALPHIARRRALSRGAA